MMEDENVIVIVDSHQYEVSKSVLKANSEYFQAMFSGNFKESNLKEIRLQGIDRVSWERIMYYVKTGLLCHGDYESSYYKENLHLLQASNMLSFSSLTKLVKDILCNTMGADNVLDIYRAAIQLDWTEAQNRARGYIFWRVDEVTRSGPFYDLLPDEVEAYLSDPAVNCSIGEMGIWKAINRWIDSAVDFEFPREIYLSRLIKCVSLKELCIYDLLAISSNHYVKESRLLSAVLDALIKEMAARTEFNLALLRSTNDADAATEEEVPAEEVAGFIASWRSMPPRKESLKPCMVHRLKVENNSSVPTVVMLDEDHRKLIPVLKLDSPDPMMPDLDVLKVVRYGEKIYLFNGKFSGDSSSCHLLWEYDQIDRSWDLIIELPEAVRYGSACVVDGDMYVVGGLGTGTVIRSQVFKVCLSQKTMTECSAAPAMFFALPSCAFKKKMYVFERRVFQFSPLTDEWKIMNVLVPDEVRVTSAMANDRFIYLAGNTGDIFKFDPDANPLSVVLIGKFTYESVKACLVHNYIYSMTSRSYQCTTDTYYEKFNIDTLESTILWKKNRADEYIITEDHSHCGSFPICF